MPNLKNWGTLGDRHILTLPCLNKHMVIVIILPRNAIFHLQLSWQVKPRIAVSSHSAQYSASNLQAAEVCIYVDLCVDLCVETTCTCGFLHADALCGEEHFWASRVCKYNNFHKCMDLAIWMCWHTLIWSYQHRCTSTGEAEAVAGTPQSTLGSHCTVCQPQHTSFSGHVSLWPSAVHTYACNFVACLWQNTVKEKTYYKNPQTETHH